MKQNQYELTYLIDPRTSEDERTTLNTAVDEYITAKTGAVQHSSPILRKKLAYKVKHQDSAFMRIMNIELAGAEVLEFSTFLKKTPQILRTTLLATSERARITPEVMEKHGRKIGKQTPGRHDKHKDMGKTRPSTDSGQAKEITMKTVEKGIESALTEEVK